MWKMNKEILARVIAVALFLAVMATSWDAWWHFNVGRDSLWEPPHLFLYSFVILAIASGVFGWIKTKEKAWKRLALVLLLIIISAPFDDLWHRMFGIENLSSPWVIWSPPHIILSLAILMSMILLLPIILKDRDKIAVRLFGAMVMASILNALLFLVGPLHPTGPWKLLGFWGAGMMAFVFIGCLLTAQRILPGIGASTLMITFFLIVSFIGFGGELGPDIDMIPHDHPPGWIVVFYSLLPAAFIDVGNKLPSWLKGAIAGLLWAGLLYGLSSYFFEPEFQYGLLSTGIAVLSSIIGGAFAGVLIKKVKQ